MKKGGHASSGSQQVVFKLWKKRKTLCISQQGNTVIHADTFPVQQNNCRRVRVYMQMLCSPSFRQVQTKCDIIQKSQGRAITKTAQYFKQKQQPNKYNIEEAHTGDKVIPEVNDYSIHIEIKTSDVRTTLFLKASFRQFQQSVSLANEFFDLL